MDLTGPSWLLCLGDLSHYREDIFEMEDDTLLSESHRVEIQNPPEAYNDRDWRLYRRCVRHEMHRRGLTTPTHDPL